MSSITNKTELFLDNFHHCSVLNLLGSELTYNELVQFTYDPDESSTLEIVKIKFEDYILVQVRIDSVLMLDQKYYHGGEFIYLLEEIMGDLDEQEDEEDEDEPEEEEEE